MDILHLKARVVYVIKNKFTFTAQYTLNQTVNTNSFQLSTRFLVISSQRCKDKIQKDTTNFLYAYLLLHVLVKTTFKVKLKVCLGVLYIPVIHHATQVDLDNHQTCSLIPPTHQHLQTTPPTSQQNLHPPKAFKITRQRLKTAPTKNFKIARTKPLKPQNYPAKF